jgi:hypothetical protein
MRLMVLVKAAGRAHVENFDVHRVAELFLMEIAKVAPATKLGLTDWVVNGCGGAP